MRRAHPAALRIEQNSGQQAPFRARYSNASVDAVLREDGLNAVPQRLVDNRLMLAWIALALVDNLATVNSVLQHQVQRAAGDRPAAVPSAVGGGAELADNAGGIEVFLQFPDRLELGVAPEDVPDGL